MVVVPSELLGLEQRAGQINKQPRGNEAGKRVIEDHGRYPQSKSQAYTYAIDSAKKTSPTVSTAMSIMGVLRSILWAQDCSELRILWLRIRRPATAFRLCRGSKAPNFCALTGE